jgi:integrase
MLAVAKGQAFRDLLVALRLTGCRPSEIATLTADRVRLDEGLWLVKNKTRRKTGLGFRPVYLDKPMLDLSRRLLAAHPEGLLFRNMAGGRWQTRIIVNRFLRLRAKLGYGPECTAYAFRHLYITDALERGIPPATVAELVGHSSLTMIFRIYSKLRLRTDHLRDAARRVRPGADADAPPPARP